MKFDDQTTIILVWNCLCRLYFFDDWLQICFQVDRLFHSSFLACDVLSQAYNESNVIKFYLCNCFQEVMIKALIGVVPWSVVYDKSHVTLFGLKP